ncbi:MAG: hypothetical protein QW487_05205 [Candidatus Bathyarchaeia archaeon]|nr:hypothetical protein [Candidatus Bathyarchaeota archaeon]
MPLEFSILDEFMKSWALRYLREAEADLSLAKECDSIELVKELSAISMRKAQLAIQHVFGDPNTMEYMLEEALTKGFLRKEPLIRLMEKINILIKKTVDPNFAAGKDKILVLAEKTLETSSTIVKEALKRFSFSKGGKN